MLIFLDWVIAYVLLPVMYLGLVAVTLGCFVWIMIKAAIEVLRGK